MNRSDYRVIMLYEFKLGNSTAEAPRNLNRVFGSDCPCERTVELWFKKFASNDFDLKEKPRRCCGSSLDNLERTVEANPETDKRTSAEDHGVHHTTVVRHLVEISEVKKMSDEEQRLARYGMCSNLLIRLKYEPFPSRIITEDEKWVLLDNRKRGFVWVDKDAPPNTFPKADSSKRKSCAYSLVVCRGLNHYGFMQADQTITAESYCCDLEHIYEKLQKLWPAVVNKGGPILLQAIYRTNHLAQNSLNHLGTEVLSHPPYFPNLSSKGYHFFRARD
ncbi:hypothetical protein RB195_007123 [Necator americanus]|uniref:Mos1 transposase HTH domain-containing protein n=1 Tax=Necator americanus TaxID=51031 RepID=A0ABR1BVQ4_NECAM